MDVVTDVLIVGTGVAGLYSALNLSEDLNITMISKGRMDQCNTALAQGGIAVARGNTDFQDFIEDTLKAGRYKNNIDSVRVLVEESMDNVNNLRELGVDFECDKDGLRFTREGAHSKNRIVYYKDITGKRVEEILLDRVKHRKNISIYEDCEMVDILKENNICIGSVCFKENEQIDIHAKVIILATGGIGGVFKNSTNERIITGDGIAIALRNNIRVKNLGYIQFHPTALYTKKASGRRFLISESVRGEGGKLINNNGERFVDELLPRDVVTKYINEEKVKTNSDNVFLDVRFMDKNFLLKRFPNIYEECLRNGIDISKDPIPIAPAQHYFMGGIDVNLYGETSMTNLYAFGEVSCTGVHGANRLASNSLLEAFVFSRRGTEKINREIGSIKLRKSSKVSYDLEYYDNLNRHVLIDTLVSLRGDISNELVSC